MISTSNIDQVIGSDVYDADGDKIGTAAEVFLDDRSGDPEWVTVTTGLFGTTSTFVPLRDADLSGDGLRVPVSKAAVQDAPKVDADQHLSPQEEEELYRHYGFAGDSTSGRTDSTTTSDTSRLGNDLDDRGQHAVRSTEDGPAGLAAAAAETTVGPGQHRDDAMTRSEERLVVGTEATEVGRVRLRKHVVTENVSRTVPVSHEEVRLEREPITDADRGDALDGPALSEEEHEVTLHAVRPVVDKQTVPVERVRLDTETVTEQQQVSAEVSHEEIEQVQEDLHGTDLHGTDGTTR